MISKAVSPLLLQRYELKYAIPLAMVDDISKAIEGHCTLDHYSQISPGQFYTINSLYFDTPEFGFLMAKKQGADPSHSLRIRSYGDKPKPPFYAEIKIKRNDFCNKLRAKLGPDWQHVVQTGELPEGLDGESRGYLERFIRAILVNAAEPKILTQYRRKAYLSNIDEYARVTFDRDLRYQRDPDFNLIPDESMMCHYDHEELFELPDECVILELKAEKKVPLWMIDVIRRFDLTRVSFSKYDNAIAETFVMPAAPRDLQPTFFKRAAR